jgi:hypothetical protein
MADTPESPKRVDGNSVPLDSRMLFMEASGDTQPFLGVADGGSQAAAEALAQVTSVAASAGTDSASVAFDEQTAADKYVVQYWVSATPLEKKEYEGTASPVVVPELTTGVEYTVRVKAVIEQGRGSYTFGEWSDTDTVTPS